MQARKRLEAGCTTDELPYVAFAREGSKTACCASFASAVAAALLSASPK